jgi:hypothetical protein
MAFSVWVCGFEVATNDHEAALALARMVASEQRDSPVVEDIKGASRRVQTVEGQSSILLPSQGLGLGS